MRTWPVGLPASSASSTFSARTVTWRTTLRTCWFKSSGVRTTTPLSLMVPLLTRLLPSRLPLIMVKIKPSPGLWTSNFLVSTTGAVVKRKNVSKKPRIWLR